MLSYFTHFQCCAISSVYLRFFSLSPTSFLLLSPLTALHGVRSYRASISCLISYLVSCIYTYIPIKCIFTLVILPRRIKMNGGNHKTKCNRKDNAVLHSAIKFHSCFSVWGRHFASRSQREFFKSLQCNDILHLQEYFLTHSGCSCIQYFPGAAPVTHHQFT